MGLYKKITGKESLRDKKKRARSIRAHLPKDAPASHKMSYVSEEDEHGKTFYTAFPTIDKSGNKQTFKQAVQSGETFSFKTERSARRFAAGTWAKGKVRREKMKAYRKQIKEERKKKRGN
jgi:hypothetical protein